MDITEVKLALEKKFNQPLSTGAKRHVVFWYDDEQSFEARLKEIIPANVHLLYLNNNFFTIKYYIEEKDKDSDILIYSPMARPPKEKDWIYDIYKYSSEFSADTVTLIMNELGLDRADIKAFINSNKKFFDNQNRFQKLKDMCSNEWTIDDIQLGMMAVACKIKHPSLEEVLKNIFFQGLDENKNKLWQSIIKWPGEEAFYRHVSRAYDYQKKSPSLKTLLISLMISDMSITSNFEFPATWKQYVTTSRNNCRIFIDHWINHAAEYKDYETLSAEIAGDLNLKQILKEQDVETYSDCETFEEIDRNIILYISNSLSEGLQDYEKYLNLISTRKSRHWYSKYKDLYSAFEVAIKMLVLKSRHPDGFPSLSPGEMILNYAEEYCKFDRYYRDFYFHSDKIDNDILKKSLIPQIVEPLYKNWFLEKLSNAWHQPMKDLCVSNWKTQQVLSQNDFYDKCIHPNFTSSTNIKLFIIISDAMRYEAGLELETLLNSQTRGSTTIKPMLGVIPSYTSLGMASLLPHKNIELKHDKKVFIDGMDSTSTDGRDRILKNVNSDSIAMPLDDLIKCSRDDARDMIKDARIIYLYHNTIDATGDHAQSEKKTFQGVRTCIDELLRAVQKIVNSLNGTKIFITSDHGFLYNREPLEEIDKLDSIKEKEKIIKTSRRFIIADGDLDIDGTQKIDMNYILTPKSNYNAYVPNGNIRFSKRGAGNLFVHGGASLQEIVVPLIEFHNIRKDSKRDTQSKRPVKVELITPIRKITNNRFNLSFFQKERVEGKLKPITLKILFTDDETNTQISDERTIIADSTVKDPTEREFKLSFTLKGQKFDKSKNYCLKIIDSETGIEIESIPFEISIAIVNDFDF